MPWICEEYAISWQWGIKVADGIKVANQMTIKLRNYPSEPIVFTRVIESRKGRQSRIRGWCDYGRMIRIQLCWFWRWRKGAQGEARNVVDHWKLEEARKWTFSRPSKGKCSSANTLNLAIWDPCQISNLQNFKVISIHVYCFKVTRFIVICYNSNRKLIHFSKWIFVSFASLHEGN